MSTYAIIGEGTERILIVQANLSHRYKFWHKEGKEQVKFIRAGSKILAKVIGKVLVYKKPKAQEFHKELMAHNARAMWLGLQSDPDRLMDNMLEYEVTL